MSKKVLVEELDVELNLWFPKYEGTVLAETDSRFKVKDSFYSWKVSWVPKDSLFCRCKEIREVK